MLARSKTSKGHTVRQSVTNGLRAQGEARRDLRSAYRRLFAENEAALNVEIGKTVVRAIFGMDSITDDSVR